MAIRRKKDTDINLTPEEAAMVRNARRRAAARMSMRVIGLSVLTGAVLVLATKKIFDEIFLEDDWSDVDWGEDEDEDYIID
jgi:hypothetical protein